MADSTAGTGSVQNEPQMRDSKAYMNSLSLGKVGIIWTSKRVTVVDYNPPSMFNFMIQ